MRRDSAAMVSAGAAWGVLGLILNPMFFVGVLVMLGLGAAWLVRPLSPQDTRWRGDMDPLEMPGGGWRPERSPSPSLRR